MKQKSIRLSYWIFTILFVLFMLFSGFSELIGTEQGNQLLTDLGYPLYLNFILGVAKVLGAIVLVIPQFKILKEWAYAGFTFDILGASALHWMDKAVEETKKSPCVRDKRGVVITNNGIEIGRGFNAPPCGFSCEPRFCEPTCKDYAVHAEMNAVADATRRGNGSNLIGARMYHARVEEGVLQNSRKPRCYQCSKHLLAFGLAEFVLKHEGGYTLYSIDELNRLSLASLKI